MNKPLDFDNFGATSESLIQRQKSFFPLIQILENIKEKG
jgi:hypothetical protein